MPFSKRNIINRNESQTERGANNKQTEIRHIVKFQGQSVKPGAFNE